MLPARPRSVVDCGSQCFQLGVHPVAPAKSANPRRKEEQIDDREPRFETEGQGTRDEKLIEGFVVAAGVGRVRIVDNAGYRGAYAVGASGAANTKL